MQQNCNISEVYSEMTMDAKLMSNAQSGSVLIIIVIMLAVLSLFPIIGQLSRMSNKDAYMQEKITAQADNIAKAGLLDAVSWFQRQPVQPVSERTYAPFPDAAFHPRYTIEPSLSATIDESTGIVNVYDLDRARGLKARYEVRRQRPLDPVHSSAVRDITALRVPGRAAGEGLAWYLESTGYIYREADPAKRDDEAPNQVVAKSAASTEIRSIQINPPAKAALIVNDHDNITLSNAIVRGSGEAGIASYSGSVGSELIGSTYVIGTPQVQDIPGVQISPFEIFGVNPSEMKYLADVYARTNSEMPQATPSMAIYYIPTHVTIPNLRGTGILYVDGDLTVVMDWQGVSNFKGVIFVDGDLTMNIGTAEADFRYSIVGTVIVTGSVSINATNRPMEFIYDESMVNDVRTQVAQYRQSKSIYYLTSGVR